MIVLLHIGRCAYIGLGDEICVCASGIALVVGLIGTALAVWRAGR